jgi:hypothetical protein
MPCHLLPHSRRFRDQICGVLTCLQELYTVTTDWNATDYCGLSIPWDYPNKTVVISLPGYIDRALNRFQHQSPSRPQHSAHSWTPITYGSQPQLTSPADTSSPLDPVGTTRLQEIIDTLLYYARAVDSTMLVALGSLTAAKTTKATAQATTTYSTTAPPTPLLLSDITQAKCTSKSTAMPPTYRSPKPAAALEAISSSVTNLFTQAEPPPPPLIQFHLPKTVPCTHSAAPS